MKENGIGVLFIRFLNFVDIGLDGPENVVLLNCCFTQTNNTKYLISLKFMFCCMLLVFTMDEMARRNGKMEYNDHTELKKTMSYITTIICVFG